MGSSSLTKDWFQKVRQPVNHIHVLQSYLVRLVEEVYHTGLYTPHEAKRVTDDIQAEHQYVELLDGLVGVVADDLGRQLLLAVELVLALKEAQPGQREEDSTFNPPVLPGTHFT